MLGTAHFSPETLLPAYALLNRIRLAASGEVLVEAERLLARITEQYFASNVTLCEHWASSELLAAAFSALVPEWTGVETIEPRLPVQVHGDSEPV